MTDHTPLLEIVPSTDLFAEGIDRIEVLGDHIRTIYWRWKLEGEIWQRVALDFSVVMPIGGLPMPIEDLRNVRVVRAPSVIQGVVQ